MNKGILAFAFTLVCSFSAFTASSDSLDAHTTAVPEQSYQTAKVWFLPDWQTGYDLRKNQGTGGGGDVETSCSDYNLLSNCTAEYPKIPAGTVQISSKLTCYTRCICPEEYQFDDQNCPEGFIPGPNRCNGLADLCVALACPAVSFDSSKEICTKYCVTDSSVCIQKKCKPTVSVNQGEVCTAFCGSACIAKTCGKKVVPGVGEVCSQHCASNTSVCTAKKCKPSASVGTGEYCTERCAADNSCTAKACKTAVTPGTGEMCSQTCSSNSLICTAKGCKPAVNLATGEQCTQKCASDQTVCTAKGCAAGYISKDGACISDICPAEFGRSPCSGSTPVTTATVKTDYGTFCYQCRAQNDQCPTGTYLTCPENQMISSWVSTTETGKKCYTCDDKQCLNYGVTIVPSDPSGNSPAYHYNDANPNRTMFCDKVDPATVNGLNCYDCCVSNLGKNLDLRNAAEWQLTEYVFDGQDSLIRQQGEAFCEEEFPIIGEQNVRGRPIYATDRCRKNYYNCLGAFEDIHSKKIYVSCDDAEGLNYPVLQEEDIFSFESYKDRFYPCTAGLSLSPTYPTGTFRLDGYVPIEITVTTLLPDNPTGY